MPDSLTLDENREASIQRASILYQIAQKCPKEKNKIYELALRIVESHRAFYSYSSRSLPKVKARNDYKITFSLYNELCLALGRVPKTR